MIACLDRAVVDLPPASGGKGQRGGKSRRSAGAPPPPTPPKTLGGDETARGVEGGVEGGKVRRLRFTSTERDILQAYKKNGLTDRAKLIQALPRPLRRLYIESWQSAVWNKGAAYRKAEWGERVVAGDLVMVDSVTKNLVTAWDLPHLAKDQGQVHRVVDDDDAALYSIDSVVVPLLGQWLGSMLLRLPATSYYSWSLLLAFAPSNHTQYHTFTVFHCLQLSTIGLSSLPNNHP